MGRQLSVNYEPLTPLSFLKRASYVFGDKTAVIYGDRHYTWKEFSSRVNRLSSALKGMGIKKGDKVAFLCRNIPPFLEGHYGIAQVGAAIVLLNIRSTADEVSYILNHSESKAIFVDGAAANLVKPDTMPGVKIFVNISDGDTVKQLPGPEYEELLDKGKDEYIELELDENDPIGFSYTSGTTGRPKGCVHCHRGAHLQGLAQLIEMGMNAYSVYLWTLPIFHIYGWCHVWTMPCLGITSVCMSRPDPEEIYRLVEKEGVTHMSGAPIIWDRLAEYMDNNELKFSYPVKVISSGACPTVKMIESIERKGGVVMPLFGLAESYAPFTNFEWQPKWDGLSPRERAEIKMHQGVANVTAGEMRVVDEEMQDVPFDGKTIGEVIMRGNLVMREYFKRPEETEKAFEGGWLHTGDGAVVHPDGYMEIKDRFKDIIISGGENISGVEVENTVCEHPDILEVAAFATEDEKWGEAVKVLVTPKPGTNPTAEDIIDFCRQRLAHFKCPKYVEFGEIPRTATGKIMKHILRQREKQGK